MCICTENNILDFITIYLKMVGMEMGLYVPISYTRELAPVYGLLLLPHNIYIRFHKVRVTLQKQPRKNTVVNLTCHL